MTQIRRLAPDSDRAALTALFRSFDAKAHQQRVQGLDSDRLAAFLADGACKSSNPTWVADDAGALRGIASLQTKHWHTEHLGFPVGKLTQLMTAPDCEDVAAPFLDQIESTAREHGLHHLTGRTDAHAFRLQETLTARGWYPVGTSVKMAAQLNDVAQPPSAVSSVSSLPPELG
jgi:hypothetical protein